MRIPVSKLKIFASIGIFVAIASSIRAEEPTSLASLRDRLKAEPLKITWDAYANGNSDIWIMNADGSNKVNLTSSSDTNEHYPQVSPDGTKICYNVDAGEGREAVRSLWIMDIDGKNRKKIADQAREPFWRPDGKVIGYLPQEYPKFDVVDFYTKGMMFYYVDTSKAEPHPNTANLRHLYHPRFAPQRKMDCLNSSRRHGFQPCDSADRNQRRQNHQPENPGLSAKHQSRWEACRLGFERITRSIRHHWTQIQKTPTVGPWELRIKDKKNKIYHIAWSRDGKYVAFSRGPDGEGDLSKPGTFQAACEIIGVYAKNWNIYAVPADAPRTIDLQSAGDADFVQLTTDGNSNKEPCWF